MDHNSEVACRLTDEDRIVLQDLLPVDIDQDDVSKILAILSKAGGSEEEQIEMNSNNADEMRERLMEITSLQTLPDTNMMVRTTQNQF